VSIFERGRQYLSKVKVSGGGRCNVTHSCFDPARLATHYPRGARELRGAFHRWQPQDTIDWFAHRGVSLKTEADGRMFPVTDDSQTIIDCFMESARSARVELHDKQALTGLNPRTGGGFDLDFGEAGTVSADAVCVACGSLKDSPLTRALESLGHFIEPLAPSLFAMNISDSRLHGLSGISVQDASVRAGANGRPQNGPLLITHRGMSGPAILRLSAWEARSLQALDYRFELAVNWLGDVTTNQLRETFAGFRRDSGKAGVRTRGLEAVPRRLWERLAEAAGIGPETLWAHLPKQQEAAFIQELVDGRYAVQGKTTNKEEFVTCGGVRLKEVDFRTMESRLVPGLHFAGECLDIDGITGGFNFQAAWTTGRIAGLAMAG
jgi:predicted Rossmann fold flavoprotein